MATICLITPPSPFLVDERVVMALGILKVAACLEQAGHSVEHLDLSGVQNYEEVVWQHVIHSLATVYGVTATTPQMPAAAKIVRVINRDWPKPRTVLGGPHVTLVNAAAKRERRLGKPGRGVKALEDLGRMFDVLVCGDGEDAVFEALKPDCPRLIDADDPRGPLFLTSARLEATPLPARHLVDTKSYKLTIEDAPALSMIAQLGCPFLLARSAGGASRPCCERSERGQRRVSSRRSGVCTRPTARPPS